MVLGSSSTLQFAEIRVGRAQLAAGSQSNREDNASICYGCHRFQMCIRDSPMVDIDKSAQIARDRAAFQLVLCFCSHRSPAGVRFVPFPSAFVLISRGVRTNGVTCEGEARCTRVCFWIPPLDSGIGPGYKPASRHEAINHGQPNPVPDTPRPSTPPTPSTTASPPPHPAHSPAAAPPPAIP